MDQQTTVRFEFGTDIDDVVGEYLAAGGRIMINPRGELQHQLRLSALLGPDAKQATADVAASFEAMAKSKKRSAQLVRLVQDFGSVNAGGWIILERPWPFGRTPYPCKPADRPCPHPPTASRRAPPSP